MSPDCDSREQRQSRTAALVERLAHTRGPAREDLLDEIVKTNMPVATMLARRYVGRGISMDDLEQVAQMGLVKAARGYDPRRGAEFLAYAIPTIRGELRRHFRDVGWVVRPPRRIQELQLRLGVAESQLTQSLQHAPSAGQLADYLGAELDEVTDALAAEGCFLPTSLDALAHGGDGCSLLQQLGGDDPLFARSEATMMLAPAVRKLTDRDRRILELRFFRGWSQQEIGDEIGVSQMQVSRLLSRILSDLRRAIGLPV